MAKLTLQLISIKAVSPRISDDFLFENGVGSILLPIGYGVSAGVVVDGIKGPPKAYTLQERTIAHYKLTIIKFANTFKID